MYLIYSSSENSGKQQWHRSSIVDSHTRHHKYGFFVSGNQACKGNRVFQVPRIGVADDKVAQYAALHYYNDKELQVTFDAINN